MAPTQRWLTAVVLLLAIDAAFPLTCWLCKGGSGNSFEDCNSRKTIQNCSDPNYHEGGNKGPLNRCAYFSYVSGQTGSRIYAKSCTFASYCTKTSGEFKTFCDNIPKGGSECNIECCTTDNCNDRQQFTDMGGDWCEWKESGSTTSDILTLTIVTAISVVTVILIS